MMTAVREGFPARFKRIRLDLNLTQQELADELGISTRTILRLENGSQTPSVKRVVQIAELFSVSPSYLIADELKQQ